MSYDPYPRCNPYDHILENDGCEKSAGKYVINPSQLHIV